MLIYNNCQLKQFYQKCQKDKIIAIDTEFYRVSTYFPKLCLIQLSSLDSSFILDPIKTKLDLNILKEILGNPKIKKIFHSASQDIEIFYNLFKEIPKSVFDTQICLMPLGYSNSTSYAEACQELLKVKIPKDNQFTDWRKRPLSKEKINYALNDVKYLIPLYKIIMKKLKILNRSSWGKEMHEKLLNKKNFCQKKKFAWERVDFTPKNHYELELIQKLSFEREFYAINNNIPVKKVLENKNLKSICNSEINLKKKEKILQDFAEKDFTGKVLKILRKPINKRKLFPIPRIFDEERKKNYKLAKTLIENKAKCLNIHPSLIANKTELKEFIMGEKNIIKGWKYKIFKKEYFLLKKLI